MRVLRTATFAAFFVLTGCVLTERMYVRTYDGPVQPRDQEALLKPYLGTVIESINGDTRYAVKPMRIGKTNLDIDIALRPGKITVVLGYELYGNQRRYFSRATQTVEFEAVAGRRYILKASTNDDRTSWSAHVEDVTEAPERWCWYDLECEKDGPSQPVPDEQRK